MKYMKFIKFRYHVKNLKKKMKVKVLKYAILNIFLILKLASQYKQKNASGGNKFYLRILKHFFPSEEKKLVKSSHTS